MQLSTSVVIMYLLIQLLTSCSPQGQGGVSSSIAESKTRNIFISEYIVLPNPYIINDSLKLEVKTAWVENQWYYGSSEESTVLSDSKYQLIMEVEPKSLKNYGVNWSIGLDGDRYIRTCGVSCLISDFEKLPKNLEEWDVQNGWKLDSSSTKTIIGKFRIIKKG